MSRVEAGRETQLSFVCGAGIRFDKDAIAPIATFVLSLVSLSPFARMAMGRDLRIGIAYHPIFLVFDRFRNDPPKRRRSSSTTVARFERSSARRVYRASFWAAKASNCAARLSSL